MILIHLSVDACECSKLIYYIILDDTSRLIG